MADIVLAPAKLTRTLRITGVRDDGYHLIDAEMVSVDLCDRLTIDDTRARGLEVVGGAPDVPVDEANLVLRALAAVGRQAHIRLEKHIPSGAGLGGGSADAAAVLRWSGCHDTAVAAALGADVPFCVSGGRARVRGIGDVVEPLEYEPLTFTLLTPPLHCSTIAVYRAWDELGGPAGDPSGNDLEPAALAVEPRLAVWRDRLGDATGLTPRLAGSGSTWFVEGAVPGDDRLVVHAVPPATA